MPLVSVLLPIRNEARHIEGCLEAILAQDYPPERMEVLIADGMSDDGTRELLASHAGRDSRIRVVDNPGRIVPTGLNAAIRACRGDIIVRIDGHTLIAPDYVREAVSALGRTGADVVGGNMTARGERPFGRAVAMATSNPMGVGGSRFHYAGSEEPAESAYMGTFRRDVFDRFGLFNESLVRNQDDEFNYRVRERGGKVWLVPSMRSVYSPRESARLLLRQYFQYGWFKVRVASLHPGMMRARHFAPSAFTLLVAVLAAAVPAAPAAAAGALAGLLALHAAASLAFSAGEGRGDPGAWLLTPLVTLILHLAYGSGFLSGWIAALLGRMPGAALPGGGGVRKPGSAG
jgi:glycosyltransferase involved in cell wall biosynthesis